MGYLSDTNYNDFLRERIASLEDTTVRDHVKAQFEQWYQQYRLERMRQRAEELLAERQGQPFALYLDGQESLHAAAQMLSGSGAKRFPGLKGFVIENAFLATQDIKMFAPYAVLPSGRGHEMGVAIFSLSGATPVGEAGSYLANDFREKFIDLQRFESIRRTRRTLDRHNVILYPLYREIQTVAIMAKQVRQADPDLRSFSLSPKPLMHEEFDVMLVEPFFYLWPLLFQVLDPDLVHMNVGWGIQALALSPFIPDTGRTVIDFYEVLSFLPDVYFTKTHSSPEQVRLAEKHFVTHYDHVMHLCSEDITTKLQEKYPGSGSIISVTEYLQEPTYSIQEKHDDVIRLVYGGNMLATTDPNDQHYRAFVRVAPCYAKENLHLYIYNSPYVHGMGENDGLKQVIEQLGLAANIHACKPLELEEFVKVISTYDYGTMFVRPKDMDGTEYNYFMAYKFLTYLRAGLPMVIDADNHFMASLVNRYQVGIVLQEYDLDNLVDILNNANLMALKENVVKFRNVFSIEKGSTKVLDMYHQILDKAGRRRVFPAVAAAKASPKTGDRSLDFEDVIASVARAENRLYYRDQSSHTLSSLVSLAQDCDPSVIVELGTLAGLSLRAWIAATERAKVFAVDLSFKKLKETMRSIPVDLTRVTLCEQDILQTDFGSMWTPQDRVIFFVDAHDLPDVPIMEYVLTTALPTLPDGSVVVVDDLWYSRERLTRENARSFFEGRVRGEIDELQCFDAHYAPYHGGGSFMGFAEVIPLLEFVNRHGIRLEFDQVGKHLFFVWHRAYLSQHRQAEDAAQYCGSVLHNPLESVPTGPEVAEAMKRVVSDYRQGRITDVAECLSGMMVRHPQDQGLSYALAVCLARVGMLSQARDVLGRHRGDFRHCHCQRLFDDLVQRVGLSASGSDVGLKPSPDACGMTIFAMPKPFVGHNGVIQRNAIRSWTRLEPSPEIILFGDEPGTREMAEAVGARHIPEVGRNEFGTPLVNELFSAAQHHASHPIVAYINADMVLFQDFIDGIQKVHSRLPEFLLIGQRWDLSVLDEIDFNSLRWQEQLLEQVKAHGILHAECGLDYFVFRTGMYREIPPFAIGRTAWDNWLVMAPNQAGVPVVDGTEFITAVHQDHDYGHVAGGRQEAWAGIEASRNRALVGGATDDSGRTSGTPWVLRRNGTLDEVRPRPPRYTTAEFKDERSAWLLEQADRLMAAGRPELAACKWEEALGLVEALLQLKHVGHVRSQGMDHQDLANRYIVTCTRLAHCYMQMGHREKVVAAYTLLLENATLQMPLAQRDRIVQIRDEVIGLQYGTDPSRDAARSASTSQEDVSRVEDDNPYPPALAGLEQTYQTMSDGTRAKHTLALRLSDLFRRAGVVQKSLMYEAEASKIAGVGKCPRITLPAVDSAVPGQPKVTVVTSCRNGQRYLRECLDSVLAQTMPEWELLLLDDGSNDGTRRIIDEYARRDRRIRAFHFDDSAGPYVRRNFAIKNATTSFIVIQDADDIMCPEKLQRLYAAITEDEQFAIVGSFYRMFLDGFPGIDHSEPVSLATNHEQILAHYRQYGLCDFSWHGSAILRKRFFQELGFYDENPFGSDSFWLAKVAEYACRSDAVRLRNIPEFLTWRRLHASSQTGTLPTFDPRSRRNKFARYRRGKLSEVMQKLESNSNADVREVLRCSVCNDFVREQGHLFEQWESQPLTDGIVCNFVEKIFTEFSLQQYVRCIATCGVVEQLAGDLPGVMPCFDLVRGLAYFGVGLYERSREYLQREFRIHETAVAREFHCQYVEKPNTRWTTADRAKIIRQNILWQGKEGVSSATTTRQLTCLYDRRTQQTPDVSIIVEWDDTPEHWRDSLQCFEKQTRKDFELVVLVPSGGATTLETLASSCSLDVLFLTASSGMSRVGRRNAAAVHARGHLVAFLDDGVVPAEDFVDKVLEAFAENDIDGLRGKITCSENMPAPAYFDLGDSPLYATCDTDELCVFRKQVYDRLGGFPETSFDRGAILLSQRLYADSQGQSRPILYCPGVVACRLHCGPPARQFTMMDRLCIEQLRQSGQLRDVDEKGAFAYLRFVASLHPHRGNLGEEEELRQDLNNTVFFFDSFPAIAIQWIQKALECQPDSTGANYLMGAACTKLDRSEEAIPFLERAMPSLEQLLARGRIDRSQVEFLDYATIRICFEASCKLLARCYLRTNQHERIVEVYTRLLENPHTEITEAERQDLMRIRDRFARSLDRVTDGAISAHATGSLHTASKGDGRPMVTIVTSCRDCEQFLSECLDSIRSQTLPAWELFLLDDGSSDGTRHIIETYASCDARIKPFYFDDSQGPYIRRNFAIQRAAAEFIVIHDADDIMDETKLEMLYHAILSDRHLAMVGSCYHTFLDEYEGLDCVDSVKLPLEHEAIADMTSTWRHGISHGAAIIRRSMFERIGLYDETPFAADSFWSAKLAAYSRHYPDGRFRNIPEYLTYYRIHSQSQTQRLPVWDPRSRRARYHSYCQCKLNRIREKVQSVPETDLAAELRQCDCSDFLIRFKANIIKWEHEQPDRQVISDVLDIALGLFNKGHYVSCVSTLHGAEAMDSTISSRVMGVDLLGGMALFAAGKKQAGRHRLDREVRNHDNPAARQFIADAFDRESVVDVQIWCRENAPRYNLAPTVVRTTASDARRSGVGSVEKALQTLQGSL